jgi:microcystin-dependent protein
MPIQFISSGDTSSTGKMFIGDYKQSARRSNHGGWLLCNGVAVSRATYLELFNEVGTSFGVGDGSATFNLPNYRGRVFGGINDSHPLGQFEGAETASLLEDNLPPHTHAIDHNHRTFSCIPSGSHNHSYQQVTYLQKAPYGNLDNERTVWEKDTTQIQTSSTVPDHDHLIDIPYFSGGSGSTGNGTSFSVLQPTLYGGNIFIYSGVL